MANPDRPIFEAGMQGGGALAFADIMLPVTNEGDVGWKMIEVKSSASIKDYHREDVAIQSYVAQQAGVKLKEVGLACIDTGWVYPGENNYEGLLALTDCTTEALSRGDDVRAWVEKAQEVAAQKTAPVAETGDHCLEPFVCGFCTHCKQGKVQPEFPIDWLPRLSPARRAQIAEKGMSDLKDVTDNLLNAVQQRVRKHTLDHSVYFDAAGAAADLAPHGLPAYFLDFETAQLAIPIWRGTRPYQQHCFQWSLHGVARNGRLSHSAFVDLSGSDPSGPFAKALIAACGNHGPIFVYNASFEANRMRELAERYPDNGAALLAIVDRLVDLLPIARSRYYHPSQHGSWSIKAVLPAIIRELSYDSLAGVKDGSMAMEAYNEAIDPATTAGRKKEIEQELRAYCRRDTFGLVRLWQFFNGRNDSPLIDVDS